MEAIFTQRLYEQPKLSNFLVENFDTNNNSKKYSHSHPHSHDNSNNNSNIKKYNDIYDEKKIPSYKNGKDTFMKNKLNTLDRKLIMVDNYSILNQNHIFIVKMFTIILLIMNVIYIGIYFKILPKTISSAVLSLLSIIFFIYLIVTIFKNSRLYRINKNYIYYSRDNPVDITKKLFPNKCDKPGHLEGSGTTLEALIDLLTTLKDTAVKYEEYGEAQIYYKKLVYILDNVTDSDIYGPFENDEEINYEIRKYSKDLERLKEKIRKHLKHKIKMLQEKAEEFKILMKKNLEKIETDVDDKEKDKEQYKLNERKYNLVMIRIHEIKKKLSEDME